MTFPARSFAECEAIMTAEGQLHETTYADIHGRRTKVYKHAPTSLKSVWEASKAFGPKDYLVYEDERYTFAHAGIKVSALASLFYHSYGVRKGDRVAICARNIPEWVFCFWATASLGAVATAVNAWLPPAAILHCLTVTTPRLVILDDERAKILASSVDEMDEVGGTKRVLVMRARAAVPEGMASLDADLQAYEQQGSREVPDVEVSGEDVATIFFTSGTTGLPKGVVGTNRQYCSNLLNSLINGPRAYLRRGEAVPTPNPNDPQKAMLLAVPLFHAVGNHSSLGLCTAMGFKIVLIHKWDLAKATRLIVDEGVVVAGGIPYMAMEIVEALRSEKHVLEGISWGGAPSSASLPQDAQARLGKKVAPAQGYGATEVSSMATGVSAEDYLLRPTSAGLPTFVTSIKIVDEHNREVPTGDVGEILISGVTVTNGYWRNKKATAEAFDAEGFYHSGDLGYVDAEGFLYISDRAKDIIIRGGENISSVAVETEIYHHPGVLDCAVVPVPDAKLGELVAAAIVPKSDYISKLTSTEIISLLSTALPKHCVPVLVVFYDALPRNGVGKTDKRVLKEALGKIWVEGQEQGRAGASTSGGGKQVQVSAKL